MEGRHARQIHDYESLQGIRVKVEGGISTFLSLSFFLIRFECFHKFYMCVCVCVRRNKVGKSIRTSFPANLIIQLNENEC